MLSAPVTTALALSLLVSPPLSTPPILHSEQAIVQPSSAQQIPWFTLAAADRPAPYPIGLNRDGRLRPCPSSTDCVSSSGKEVTNKAMSPLSFSPTSRDSALARAASFLRSRGAAVAVDEEHSYIHAVLQPAPSGIIEDIELLLIGGEDGTSGLATFRDVARVKTPTPPWCLEKGCINGNQEQRKRMTGLAEVPNTASLSITLISY